YDLASLSKCVGCASSAMVLLSREKIAVNDPVAKYLPDFAANGKETITLENLMIHQSGLVADNPMKDYADGPEEAIKKVMALKPTTPPGTKYVYSDMNMLVMGKVIEAVSGKTLDQFAKAEVFEPLKMKDTMYNPPKELWPRCAPTTKSPAGKVHDPRSAA